jgi:acyl carrier protein
LDSQKFKSKQEPKKFEKTNLLGKNKIEQEILDEWCECLTKKNISMNNDFFEDLGGNSLLAMNLIFRIQHKFNSIIRIEFHELIDNSSVIAFSSLIKSKLSNMF